MACRKREDMNSLILLLYDFVLHIVLEEACLLETFPPLHQKKSTLICEILHHEDLGDALQRFFGELYFARTSNRSFDHVIDFCTS